VAAVSKRLWTLVVLLAGFSLLVGPVWSAVTGDCVNCHTMHNSQDGAAVAQTSGGSSEAQMNLLTSDCVGCHSNMSGVATIIELGNGNKSRVPIVLTGGEPTYPPENGSSSNVLAGGNFYWVATGGDEFGHNVYGISTADQVLGIAPGGTVSCLDCHRTLATAASGCSGCHLAAHHIDDGNPTDAVDAGDGWYRFLTGATMSRGSDFSTASRDYLLQAFAGVSGLEDQDWEQNPALSHNVYKGTKSFYANAAGGGAKGNIAYNSIGAFCSGCHSNFHHERADQNGGMGGAGVWIRHPSDVLIPDEGEYLASSRVYDPVAPFAKDDLAGASRTDYNAAADVDVVTCVSCHRPHGSPYPDMLRWEYSADCVTGVGNSDCGCFACHTGKD